MERDDLPAAHPGLSDRAREKQASREQDARDLESGAKSPEQLRLENGQFGRLPVQVHLDRARALL